MQEFQKVLATGDPNLLRNYFQKPENFPLFCHFFFYEKFSVPFASMHHRLIKNLAGSQNLAIAYPRGFAKSTLVSFAFALFSALYTKKNILLISATQSQSQALLKNLTDEFHYNFFLKNVYNFQILKSTIDQLEIRINKRKILISCASVGTSLRGQNYQNSRPDLIILDDIESENLPAEKVENWLKKVIIPLGTAQTRHILVGTILSRNSLLQKIITKKTLPDFYQILHEKALTEGLSAWEARYPTAYLETLQKTLGTFAFSCEYQNSPVQDQNALIRENWLQDCHISDGKILYNQDSVKISDCQLFLAIDPAISQNEKSDYTAMALLAYYSEKYFILDLARARFTMRETVQKIQEIYQKWHPQLIGLEVVAYQKALADELKLLSLPLRTLTPDGDKTRRLLRHQAIFEFGKIFFTPSCEILKKELLEFPRGEHDDTVDALTYALELAKNSTLAYLF